jgi:hypothetical protein
MTEINQMPNETAGPTSMCLIDIDGLTAEIKRLEMEREWLRVEACRWRNEAMALGHRGWLDR